ILVVATLGHDAWISYSKDLPFALSDFGWIITTYVPSIEQYILETIEPDDQARFISPIFNLETLWVVCILMSVIALLAGFFKLSDSMGDISLSKGDEPSTSVRKRDQGKRMKYKRK
ncbi:MAG: hypothetical protein ACPG05_00335, partial [Bdellovibrionales bacterium]